MERLVFSENFVKEESEETDATRVKFPLIDQTDKQAVFSRHFGQGNIYDTPDRRGIAVDLLILFRDIHPKVGNSDPELIGKLLFITGWTIYKADRTHSEEQHPV